MLTVLPARRLAALSPLVIILCLGVETGCSENGSELEPRFELIPSDVATQTLRAECLDREEASVVAVSSEGDLWLSQPGELRIINSLGTEKHVPLSLGTVVYSRAWSAGELTFVREGELWQVDADGAQVFIPVPEPIGKVTAFCGDPARPIGSFVATDVGLFERVGETWWKWTQQDQSSFGTIAGFAANDGACISETGALRLINTDGELWEISESAARIVGGQKAPIDRGLAMPNLGIVALSAGDVQIGSPTKEGAFWRTISFEAGPVSQVSNTGDELWALAGDSLYRYSENVWNAIDISDHATPTQIWGDANGAWAEFADSICRVQIDVPVTVRGLRPFDHRTEAVATLQIFADTPALTVAVDGEVAPNLMAGTSGQFTVDGLPLGQPGWHTLEIQAEEFGRSIEYFVVDVPKVSWETDIEPIMTANCGGALCHGPTPDGNRVDLSRFDSWKERALQIRRRLVRGEMPPGGSPLPTETIELISTWIEGGMLP